MKKRLLSLLLVFVMVLGMIPTSVFAVEGIPFTVTVGDEEVTEITEGVVSWTDWSGTPSDVTCYTVTVPQDATEATLDFDEDMQWMYYDSQGNYVGQGDTSTTSQTSHTVAIQDSNSDGELDGISVQIPDSWSTSYYIQFVYAAGEQTSCVSVQEDASQTATVSAGGLYKLKLVTVFADSDDHDVSYDYSISPAVENEHTKIANGEFCFTAQELGDYEVTLTAECANGKTAEHKLTITVEKASEGIAAQYGYDETDKSTVTVYVNISNDGMPLGLEDGTVLANLEVTVPYFDLSLYGLENFYRYGTENGKGPYVNDTVIRRPTGLHLYIYLLERYYMGLPEEQCCLGSSGVLQYAKEQEILYMTGDPAYSSGGKSALTTSGGATSIYMTNFWGHDENLMYFRNHCYPYMAPGWGSTSDYILLSDGDSWDVGMFSDWAFNKTGYFASFDQDCYSVEQGGSSLTVKAQKWGTSESAKDFEEIPGSAGLSVALYNSSWQEIESLNFDSQTSNTITFTVPEEDGVYYLLAMDPDAGNFGARIAPAAARIVVGSNDSTVDVSTYYENYDFLSIKDDQDRYLVDITPGTVDASSNYQSENVPTHQVIIEEGTQTIYATFPAGTFFQPYTATYTISDGSTNYGSDMLTVTQNDDGTITVAIPTANYTDMDTGVIVEGGDDEYSYNWLYGFDFVTGTITKVQAGTAVSRILLNSYSEHLWIGNSVTLVPTVLPAEATDWTIAWSSSNETVATVDQSGKITAVGEGTATITAAIGDVKATCTVNAEAYNSAPVVVSGAASWAKIKSGASHTVDVAAMFTDAENNTLTYTVQACKASGLNSSWEYNYTGIDGFNPKVLDGKCTVIFDDIGIYALKITASDGKLSATHTYQLTVVDNDAGVVKLNDGVTMDLYNVVAVGYSTEFVEDYEIPYKGTHDTTIHHIVLSRDTSSGIPPRKFAITLESGYQWGQYGASGVDTKFQTRADIGVFAYDPNLNQSTAHFLQFHTECATHADADKNCICDKCTMQLPAAGQFALMAVNADGFVIEPCYVSYAEGATVKDALKNSGHTFTGIDSGFISAIDGKTDNYSMHYDGNGYSLDAAASRVTAIWFTTNASQAYSENLLNLAAQMAKYNTATNGVQEYPVAQQAYAAAVKDFYQTSNAAKLYTDLKTAMDKYDAFLSGEKVTVTMSITMGDGYVSAGKAVFTSEFGTTVETEDLIGVDLVPGTYTFDISDGSFRHVRGTIKVEGAMVLTATLPTGNWIASVGLGIASGEAYWRGLPADNKTLAGATFYVPDYSSTSLYPYIMRGAGVEGNTTHKVFLEGSTSARTWESKSTALAHVIEEDSLTGTTLVLECRRVSNPGEYEQYQTYTMKIVRTPSLERLTVSGDGTAIKLDFAEDTLSYVLTTGADTVVVTPTALDARSTITVAGKAAVSGEATSVKLADCTQNEDGTYMLPIEVIAPNGQKVTYTLQITKVATVNVNVVTSASNVRVKLFNDAGAELRPLGIQGTRWVFKVIPGQTYTYITTLNTYYHATASITPTTQNEIIKVAAPKTGDLLTTLVTKTASSSKTPELPIDKTFDPTVHEYTTWMDSNSGNLYLRANAADKSTHTVTAHYLSSNASAYNDYGGLPRQQEVATIKNTTTSATKLNRAMGTCGWSNVISIHVTQNEVEDGVTYYEEYILTANRTMTLNSLTAADHNGNALVLAQNDAPDTTKYDKAVLNYTTKTGSSADHVQVSLKVVSSNMYAYDADWYTVTVACGEWNQVLTFTKDDIAQVRTVAVPMNGTVNAENITVTVAHRDTGAVAQTYTIEVEKLPPVATTFTIDPADAIVFLTDDISGGRVYPEADGTYILNTDASYTYVITRNGYVAQTASFIAGEANKTITATLAKAPETSLKDISQTGDWLQFRADENNNGVVNVKTPIKAEDAVLEWANKIGEGMDSGATGCPIIVGGYLYTYAGKSIVKVNKDTGEVVANGVMIGSSSFAINSPTYADGMLFVGLSNGRVQAFNAETLESLWVFQDALGGQPNCPIVYCDGYVYTGFWNSETKQAHFVCLSVTDEDTANTTESKLPTWTYTHNGFYWAGAYACEDFVLIGTDDGDSGYTAGFASILSLDPKTGVLLDEEKLPNVGDQRSSICYDAATNAYYFTTKGGDFYQIKVNADGTFTENSLRRLHLDNGSDNVTNPPMSTSTPVIYNGRAYIGVSGVSQFGNYSGHNMTVIDLETFSIAYSVPTMGYPQTSGLLTTAYENVDGYVYVYFIDNASPGMIRVIRDKKGMTEVDHSYTSTATVTVNGQSTTIETGYILFTPYGDEAQYAICSPIADSEGNLYFKNDSACMMRLSSRMTSLEIVQQPEKKDYCVGKTFDGTGMKVIAHYANGNSKDVTRYVSFTTDPLTVDDTEITVSFAPDKMFEKNTTAAGGYWQWYQDVNGAAGQTYYLPTATVNITINSEHSFTNYKSNNDATCEADGTKTATCDHCDAIDTQTDVGSKLTHSFTNYKSNNDATCEADGTKTAVCDRDGCEEKDTQPDVGSKLTHSFTDYKSDNNATCEADGTKTAVCDRDGCEEKDTQPDVGSKLTHSFTDYKSDNNATCEADGTKTAVCDRDGCEEKDTQPDVGSKLTHSFTDYKSDNNATCEADGTKTAVCDHEGCEEKDTQPDVGSKLGHSFTDYKSNNDATYEADGTKTAVCDRDGCEATDTQPDEGSKKVEPETKLEITEGGITVVPDSLKEVGLDTPEKVKQTITKAIITQNSKVDEKNIAHYDVTLMYSEDGGKTWIKADESHWPASGKIKVTLPYPSGTDKTYSFTVVHMFTSSAFGKTPGDVEMPTVTNTDKGIEFEVTGLSPISVGWTAPKETPADPSTPATGDTTNVVLLTCVMLLSVTMLVVLLIASKKRRA